MYKVISTILVLTILTACSHSYLLNKNQLNLESSSTREIKLIETPACKYLFKSYELSSECISETVAVEPGHYQLSLEIKGHNIEERIDDFLNISIEYYDQDNNILHSSTPYLNSTIEGSTLNGTLITPSNGLLLNNDTFVKISLINRPYPADTGWIQDPIKKIRLAVKYQGKGTLWLKNISLNKTSWHLPLKDRNSCTNLKRDASKNFESIPDPLIDFSGDDAP